MSTELLPAYRRLRSADIDEARERVSEAFCAHRLEPLGPASGAGVRFNAIDQGAVGLSYLAYDRAVRIRPEHLSTFVLVQIPLAGRAVVRTGDEEIVSDPTRASVPDPDADLDMRWEAGNAQLIVRIERAALEERLRRLLGRASDRPLRLATSLDLTTPAARSWLATVELLRADADGPSGLAHPALRDRVHDLVLDQLLTTLPHSESAALATGEPGAAPRAVRRAEQLIVDHAREELTVDDVAEAVGLSVRALQEGFRRHLGTTPTARLREARLVGVRAALAGADAADTTVAAVAAGWGFWHLGRFAGAYRERWGESPSATLRA